jgi:nucleoside-diphosphate-sugar epimerase
MNILVSGANGFIGAAILKYYTNSSSVSAFGTVRQNAGTKCYNIDLVDANSVNSFIETIKKENRKFECFVHCASILATPENGKLFTLFEDNNKITQHVISIVTELNIKTLINLSTIGVYPNADGNYSETSLVKPSENAECLYSLSKFCSEELFNFYLKPLNVNVTNLRLSQVFGEGMRTDRIYKIMEQELIEKNQITVWGNGERVSNFVNVTKVLSAIDYFISYPTTALYNVGGNNISYAALAELVKEHANNTNAKIILVDMGVKSKVYIETAALDAKLASKI